PIERGLLAVRELVVVEGGPRVAAADVVLLQSRQKPAGRVAVASSRRSDLALLPEAPNVERQASSRPTRACGQAGRRREAEVRPPMPARARPVRGRARRGASASAAGARGAAGRRA